MPQNIVWKRTDNSVAITNLQPEALEKIELARSYSPLVAEREAIRVEHDTLDAQLNDISQQIEAKNAALKRAADALQIQAQNAIAELPEKATKEEREAAVAPFYAETKRLSIQTQQEIQALQEQAAPLEAAQKVTGDKLSKIFYHDEIKANIGLDSHGHEAILVARGNVPDGHQCVAHDIELPASRRYRQAWRWTTLAPVIDIDQPEARRCVMREIRARRDAELAALDGPQREAKDDGDTSAFNEIEAKKQKLRDMPEAVAQEIKGCRDLRELDAVTYEGARKRLKV